MGGNAPGDFKQSMSQAKQAWWTNYDSLFQSVGTQYGIDWKWLKAFALTESELGSAKSVGIGINNPNDIRDSVSSDGKSWGLMQVTLSTAKGYDPTATPEKLNDPSYSVDMAAQVISDYEQDFSPADPRYLEWVVKSYNQGPGNTQKEIETGIGFADAYWTRWQANLNKVEANKP
ncbi:MAG: transglycosylase SLT domain-containing protein [Patescibacteria group bacterium]|nr:transglycosylase SLT domain-containing protein [Patescibacteria group bacterium]